MDNLRRAFDQVLAELQAERDNLATKSAGLDQKLYELNTQLAEVKDVRKQLELDQQSVSHIKDVESQRIANAEKVKSLQSVEVELKKKELELKRKENDLVEIENRQSDTDKRLQVREQELRKREETYRQELEQNFTKNFTAKLLNNN